jgi:uncharacterized protein (DUF608 family)
VSLQSLSALHSGHSQWQRIVLKCCRGSFWNGNYYRRGWDQNVQKTAISFQAFGQEYRIHVYHLEQLHPCSVCGTATIFLTSKISYLLFPNLTHKRNCDCKRCENINGNPHGTIKPSSQSTASVKFCCVFCQPQHPVQTKTIMLSQTGMF